MRVERRSISKKFILLPFKNVRDRIILEASLMIFEDYQIDVIRISMNQNVNSGNNI